MLPWPRNKSEKPPLSEAFRVHCMGTNSLHSATSTLNLQAAKFSGSLVTIVLEAIDKFAARKYPSHAAFAIDNMDFEAAFPGTSGPVRFGDLKQVMLVLHDAHRCSVAVKLSCRHLVTRSSCSCDLLA